MDHGAENLMERWRDGKLGVGVEVDVEVAPTFRADLPTRSYYEIRCHISFMLAFSLLVSRCLY